MLGIAVHSNYLLIVDGGKEEKVSYNFFGVQKILNAAKDKVVLIAGNWRWARTIAYFLESKGFEVRYLPLPGKARGIKMAAVAYLKKAMEAKIKGRPFFSTEAPEPQPHPWRQKAIEYLLIKDDIRRAKLRIIEQLRLLCVEAMENPRKIWTNAGRDALLEVDWEKLIKITSGKYIPREKLLNNFVPSDEKEKAFQEVLSNLDELEGLEEKGRQLKAEIMEMVEGHKIVSMFKGAFAAAILTCLIGWRSWEKFRHLRSYSGLSVKRVDSKGRLRISRVRPEIRMTLFQLMKTKKAQEIISEGLKRRGKEKAPLPKRMEILLKEIWKNCLRP